MPKTLKSEVIIQGKRVKSNSRLSVNRLNFPYVEGLICKNLFRIVKGFLEVAAGCQVPGGD